MFLVMSRLDVHFGFGRPFFLRAQSGKQVKLRAEKSGA